MEKHRWACGALQAERETEKASDRCIRTGLVKSVRQKFLSRQSQAFRAWFADALVAAYASLEEFEFQAPKDFFQLCGLTRGILLLKSFIVPYLNLGVLLWKDLQMDLVLQLDAEGVEQQDEGLETPLRRYA